MKLTAKVVNLPEFQGKLNRLAAAARGDALGRAAMAGGQVIEANAKINANRVFSAEATNTLAGSIHTELISKTGTSAEVSVGPSVVYGRIQELGGWIKPVTAKALSWINKQGVRVFAKAVYIPPRPYLRPAADEHQPEILQAVGASLKRDIEGAAK